MTAREAIKYLKDPIGKREQHDDAVNMAIEALQKFDAIATDIISRQDAIDLAYDCEDEFGKDVAFRFAHYLRRLPSAQTERKKGTSDAAIQGMPTAQPDWTEMLVICDNCGHAIHVKREEQKDIMRFPSAQPEIIHCGDCRHHHRDVQGLQYCDRIDYGYGWKDEDFCSRAERVTK